MLMTRHFDYCPSASEGDNQSVGSSAPVVSRCFPGGYNVKLYISRGRLAWWLLALLHSDGDYIGIKGSTSEVWLLHLMDMDYMVIILMRTEHSPFHVTISMVINPIKLEHASQNEHASQIWMYCKCSTGIPPHRNNVS